MVEKVKELIEQIAQQKVENTSGISNNLSSDVAKETGNSIVSGFKDALSNGQVNDIMGLMNINASAISSNPVVQNIVNSLTGKLSSNFGIDTQAAVNFSQSVIPQILSTIFSKAKDGNGGFNIADIISSLSGGQGGGILDSLKGLDQNGDGQVNIQDAISALGGKGGLGNILGGFFKK
ncbi:hypothetical protein Pedsa_0364 [Pseudopedobacter saltans DSM 12145]|uniref:EF-hand domain-containing protein n=1 Tax=Pseudopedobacter saltans (strain ATCC 51119 / DSM 12145 / JCM 21818 / CCUG 39354 / LMG 10337 / NBRC 100064 / NCIMB 13643) TaxID=762903 RepID=F0S529_PSESL|nr:DUF937 domain-containing protein [Pseudopedobacter saltans]ADY50946.1 hypothetical protein Pedsa_0364 [Pseudopedobacter saltans DSM 12145]